MANLIGEIQSALSVIPPDDRDMWVKIGMAIKDEFGEEGLPIWDAWSMQSDSYNEKAARSAWRSFKPGPVTIRTLFYVARANGYMPGKTADIKPAPAKKAPPTQKTNTGAYAAKIWIRARCTDEAVAAHSYAIKKGITTAGGAGRCKVSGAVIGQDADCIVVPVRDLESQRLTAVQCVNSSGAKQSFGSISGNALLLGNTLNRKLDWFVCEGWASAYSAVFHHFKGNACAAAAFGKGNLDNVAARIAEIYDPIQLRVLREIDA